MNTDIDPRPSDEIAATIRGAFQQQEIPPRPPDKIVIDAARIESADRLTRNDLRNRISVASFFGSVPVVAACVFLAIAIWPAKTDTPSKPINQPNIPEADSVVESLRSDREGDIDSSVAVPQPPIVAQNPEIVQESDERGPDVAIEKKEVNAIGGHAYSNLLIALRAFNSLLSNRKAIPYDPASRFHSYFGSTSEHFGNGFAALGKPRGIKSIVDGVSPDRKWVRGDDDVAFTYEIEMGALEDDLGRFLSGVFEVDVLDDILEGLRRDPDGPKVDLREELFSRIRDKVIVVVNEESIATRDRMLIVVPVTDGPSVSRAISRMLAIEPDVAKETHRGVLLSSVTKDGQRRAVCIANQCLIIGDWKMVRDAIDRSEK